MNSSISRSAASLFTTRRESDEALDDQTEAVTRKLESRHKEGDDRT